MLTPSHLCFENLPTIEADNITDQIWLQLQKYEMSKTPFLESQLDIVD